MWQKIKQLFLFAEQIDQLEVCLPYSKLLTGILMLAIFQNLRWEVGYKNSKIRIYKASHKAWVLATTTLAWSRASADTTISHCSTKTYWLPIFCCDSWCQLHPISIREAVWNHSICACSTSDWCSATFKPGIMHFGGLCMLPQVPLAMAQYCPFSTWFPILHQRLLIQKSHICEGDLCGQRAMNEFREMTQGKCKIWMLSLQEHTTALMIHTILG